MTEPVKTDDNREVGPSGGFDFNQPSIISLCFLGSFVTGITGLVGIVLAHVWQGDNQEGWAASHFTYLIRTFWIGLLATVALGISIIGLVVVWVPMVWVVVRSVLSLIKAQKQEPMPDPKTLLF